MCLPEAFRSKNKKISFVRMWKQKIHSHYFNTHLFSFSGLWWSFFFCSGERTICKMTWSKGTRARTWTWASCSNDLQPLFKVCSISCLGYMLLPKMSSFFRLCTSCLHPVGTVQICMHVCSYCLLGTHHKAFLAWACCQYMVLCRGLDNSVFFQNLSWQ